MKLYVYNNSLYHKCRRGKIVSYDNLYIFSQTEIWCQTCRGRAPIALTMMFALPDMEDSTRDYKRVGPATEIYVEEFEAPWISTRSYNLIPKKLLDMEIELEEEK